MFWMNKYSNNLKADQIISKIIAKLDKPSSKDQIFLEFQNEYALATDTSTDTFREIYDNTVERLRLLGFLKKENDFYRLFAPLYVRWLKKEKIYRQ